MAKANPWKIGIGTGLILIGAYLSLNKFSTIFTVSGLVLIAIGIGVIASN